LSPYGENIISEYSKVKYLPMIEKGLDAKSASWIFNTSKAISAFEITM
jgi:hypothetical protein